MPTTSTLTIRPIDPARLPTRRAQSYEPEAEDELKSELERILNGTDVDIPGLHRDDPDWARDVKPGVAEAAATSGGPGLAAASAAAVAQSSAAAAPSSAPSYMGRQPPPMPMPANPSGRGPPQPQTFDISGGDPPDATSAEGARSASAKKALAQLLLHRPRQ